MNGYMVFNCHSCNFFFTPEAFDTELDYNDVYQMREYIESQINSIRDFDIKKFAQLITYKPFFKNVKKKSSNNLLDIGCGVGRFCHLASSRGWQTTGIDISTTAIHIGREYAKSFVLENCGIDDLIEKGRTYDVITAFEVLEHLSDPAGFLNKIKKILGPGGELFCTVPNWECDEVQQTTKADWLPPIHICFFTLTALKKLCKSSGFHLAGCGIIWTDSRPSNPLGIGKWICRRIKRKPSSPLGIWFHANLQKCIK